MSNDKLMLQALRGETTPRIPFWLMRQAGRYLPEYRDLRKTAGSFLDLCFTPDFAVEVTLQPLRRFDMDAAILFSDILVVPYALGQALSFVEGEGPRLGAFKTADDFKFIDSSLFDQKLSPVYETIRRLRTELAPDKTLIGFAGAPWTIACYMIQGYGDGAFAVVKKFASENTDAFQQLIDTLVTATAHYLIQQIKNGVDTVQIFDSWAGLVPDADFDRWVIQPTRAIVQLIRKEYPLCPIIGFPRGAGARYKAYAAATGVNAVGLDQSVNIKEAVASFGDKVALQGNLDPEILLRGGAEMEKEIVEILQTAGNNPFIFNLGHGVIKETPPQNVARLSELVLNFRR